MRVCEMTGPMRKWGPLARLARRFGADSGGHVAMIFGAAFVPVLFVIGGGIDYATAFKARTNLQHAVDSAALAAVTAKGIDNAARTTLANNVFNANIQATPMLAQATKTVSVGPGQSTVTAELNVPTAFLRAVGVESIPVKATGGVASSGKKLELAMMLDTTGSMGETIGGRVKIADLKLAANDLLNIIFPDGAPASEDMKVALAPFSSRVNVGNYASAVTGLAATSGGNKLRRCVTERQGSTYRYTDEAPGAGKWIGPYNANDSYNYGNNYSSTGNCSPGELIMPLTSNKAALSSHINSFTADGNTAGHLGTAWAWYMLSPKWNSIWPTNAARAYDDNENMKVAVLMTDGIYNQDYTSGVSSKTMALNLCTAMKSAPHNVTVYTVGFGLPDTSEYAEFRQMLKDCASPSSSGQSTWFFPYDGDSLRQAFQVIGQQLSAATGKSRLAY